MSELKALKPDAVLVFKKYWMDDEGAHLHFVCYDPGPGEPNDYYLKLEDKDLAGATTEDGVRNLIDVELKKKLRAMEAAPKLDGLIGESWTV